MPRRQLSEWADLTVSAIIALLMAIAIVLLIASLGACRTVDATKTSSAVDSTARQTKQYDSTSYKLYEQLFAHYKEIAREYKPGRDSVIYINGEPQVVQLPGQLVREIIREGGQQQTKGEEKTQVSKTDSLLVEVIRTFSTKEKETSSIPVWGWLLFGFVGLLFILGGFLILLLILRKKGTV